MKELSIVGVDYIRYNAWGLGAVVMYLRIEMIISI